MDLVKVGRIIFIVGLLISVIAGLMGGVGEMGIAALVVLGIIVGGINITGKEIQKFLLAIIALLLVGSTIGTIPEIGTYLHTALNHFLAFVSGAALLVSLREIYYVAKGQ